MRLPLEQFKWIALPGPTGRLVMPIHQAPSNFVKLSAPRQRPRPETKPAFKCYLGELVTPCLSGKFFPLWGKGFLT